MILKLLTSLALSGLVALALISGNAENPIGIAFGVLVLFLGYHRNITPKGGAIPFGRVVTAAEPDPRVRYSVWGFPLGPAGRLRVSEKAKYRAENARIRSLIMECLPAGLRWLVRKLSP
ncbi:MAG: hypothetical protein ACJAYU_000559 [Bradymonadia bacterium]|jgi:hypothetical protein